MLTYQPERGVTTDYATEELLKYVKATCDVDFSVK
jgi:hypothetical protein